MNHFDSIHDAAQYELEVEHNSAYDYQSELWASERDSMADEGFQNHAAYIDEQFEAGEISQTEYESETAALQSKFDARRPQVKSDQQKNDEIIDALFAPGGKFSHTMRNEDNGPE